MSLVLGCVALAFGAAFVVALHHGNLMSDSSFGGRSERQRNSWKSSYEHRYQSLLPVVPHLYFSLGWSSKREYDWDLSTEDNYQSTDQEFFGKYADIRSTLDYTYHKHYSEERQLLQDEIIDSFLNETRVIDEFGNRCLTPSQPWLVLTAGAMGAGKSFTVRQLAKRGLFPLDSFVVVDADQVRRQLPEFAGYIQRDPERAGERTKKEAGFITEILTEAALRRGQNVLVDGSLKDATWYQAHLDELRRAHPNLRTCILHVMAPREAIFQRAMQRAHTTGRVVPYDVLVHAMEQVPKSVDKLRSRVDLTIDLYNAPNATEVQIITEGVDWDSFRRTWTQNCSQ